MVLVMMSVAIYYSMGPGAVAPETLELSAAAEEPQYFYSIDLDELVPSSVIPTNPGGETPEPETPTESTPPAKAKSKSSKPAASNKTTTRKSEPALEEGPPPTETPEEPRRPTITATSSRTSQTGSTATGGVTVMRRSSGGVALSDPAEIAAMVREAMSRYSEQFSQCHTKMLKQDETFRGIWELTLVVGTDGSASRVTVAPKDETASNEDFEACMISKVEKWKFKTTTEAMEIRKRYTFDS